MMRRRKACVEIRGIYRYYAAITLSPSDENTMLNVAICSYGMSSKVFHAPLIAAEAQLNLHTILQRSSESALADYPDVKIAKTFEDILGNPDIDLVVVNTPNELHYSMTKAALLASKHVVTEKPFTLSMDEGKELIELAQQQGKTLAVFHNKRLETDHLTLQKILHENVLGRVVEIEWHYDRYRNTITHKAWKENNLPGAGTWFDLGVHMLDSMLILLGRPQALNADMRSLRRAEGSTDYFNVCFHYADMRVFLRSNTFVSEKGPTVAAHGVKGSFLKFGQDVQEQQLMNGLRPIKQNGRNMATTISGFCILSMNPAANETRFQVSEVATNYFIATSLMLFMEKIVCVSIHSRHY